jgi:hypothetical protein
MKVVSFVALLILGVAMVALYLGVTRRSRGIGRRAEREAREVSGAPEPFAEPPAAPAMRSAITLPDGTTVDPADPQGRRRARELLEAMDPVEREAYLAQLRRR